MSNRVPCGTKSHIAGNKSSFENKFLPKRFLSVEQAFSFLIRPHPRQELVGSPDEHLTGIYFHIVEGNFFRRPDGVIQLVDYGRVFARVKTCGLPNDRKKEIRDACKRKKWERLYQCGVFTHPSFKECFRLKIGNRLISHLSSMNSIHALYLAFSVSCTSKVLAVTLSHSYGTFKGIRQNEIFPMTMLFLYYQRNLKGISMEKDIVKRIKVSLCTEFSIQADQELPEGYEKSFRIFPKSMQVALDSHLRDRKERLAFYFSILQGKSLCYEVSEQFVQETLEKHKKTLCEGKTRKLQPEFRAELVEQGKRLGLYLRDHYNPFLTSKAPVSASYSYSRERGGVLGELIDRDNVFTGKSHLENDPDDRCEPLVIGLFGEPACGKSTLVQELISSLQHELFPYMNLQDVSYSRSCSMKHWDGYTGQPIVVLDDFGQSSDRYDTIEFQQLVSCNPYQLPMAELKDKGQMFTSPIILLTSNMTYGRPLSTPSSPDPVEDNLAFWRRIHIPVLLGQTRKIGNRNFHTKDRIIFTECLRNSFTEDELKDFEWSRPNRDLEGSISDPFCSPQYFQPDDFRPQGRGRRPASDCVDNYCSREFPRESLLLLIIRQTIDFRDHFFKRTSKYWNQIVSSEQVQRIRYESGVEKVNVVPLCGENQTISYRFPRHPPKEILPVRVEPIKEPLKCRTITAGVSDTRCLKPLQRCMWDYLGTQKQFKLTHGTKFLERSVWNCRSVEQGDPKLQEALHDLSKVKGDSKVWVSGDYSAATDNFILDCGAIILKSALSHIDHKPTYEWAMKEMSSHLLVYPKDSGIKPGIQRNGQLMGSLLSFPLLCLVNDSTARLAGAKQDEYLINGDDILMRVKPNVGDRWRQIAPSLGLELSIGKTFVDPDFGTVNSQLFYKGEIVPTGKIKTANRRCQVLGETFRDFMRFHNNERQDPLQLAKLYLQWNRPSLMKTFESLKVPTSHGGLGLFPLEETNPVRLEQDLLVYLTKLRNKLSYRKGFLKFPFIGLDDVQNSSNGQDVLDRPDDYDHEEGVLSGEMLETSKQIDKTPVLRTLRQSIKEGSYSLLTLPDLDFIQFKEMESNHGREAQTKIVNRFLNTLFDEDITRSLEAQELLSLFRAKKENRVLDSLGVVTTPRKEEPHSTLLDSELVPVLLCPERFWSNYFNSPQHSESLRELEMPEKNQVFSRDVPWSQIPVEDIDVIVDFSKEISEFDVSPMVHVHVPDFEVHDGQGLKPLLSPSEEDV